MPVFFSQLIRMSVMASVGIIMVLILKKLFGKKLSPLAHMMLWMPVILKLTIPYTPESKLSVYNFVPEQEIITLPLQIQNSPTPEVIRINLIRLVYILGILTIIAVNAASMIRFKKHISKSQNVPVKITKALKSTSLLCKLKKSPQIIICSNDFSPMTFGFIKPKILLPQWLAKDFHKEQLSMVLAHECIHIKKKDYLINIFLVVLNAIHWFNPFVWLMTGKIKHDSESLCDEMVLKLFSKEQKLTYSETILDIAASSGYRAKPSTASAMSLSGKVLKQRLVQIYSFGKKKFTLIALPICLMLSVTLMTTAMETELSPTLDTAIQKIENVSVTLPGNKDIPKTEPHTYDIIDDTSDDTKTQDEISDNSDGINNTDDNEDFHWEDNQVNTPDESTSILPDNRNTTSPEKENPNSKPAVKPDNISSDEINVQNKPAETGPASGNANKPASSVQNKPSQNTSVNTAPAPTTTPDANKSKIYTYKANGATAVMSNDYTKGGFSCNTGSLNITTKKVTRLASDNMEGLFTISRDGEVIAENVRGKVSANSSSINFSTNEGYNYSFALTSKTVS